MSPEQSHTVTDKKQEQTVPTKNVFLKQHGPWLIIEAVKRMWLTQSYYMSEYYSLCIKFFFFFIIITFSVKFTWIKALQVLSETRVLLSVLD